MKVTVRTEKKMLTSRTFSFSFSFSHEVTMIITDIWCSCSEVHHRQADKRDMHYVINTFTTKPLLYATLWLPPSKYVTQVQLFLHGKITKHSLIDLQWIYTMLAYSLVSLYPMYRVWEYQMNIIKIFRNQMVQTHM
jgi:hypothetical protein